MITNEKVTVTLAGTTWVTIKEFGKNEYLQEYWLDVPVLASGSNVLVGLFDKDNTTDGDERYASGNLGEDDVVDKNAVDRYCVDGDLLRIKTDHADDTEDVDCIVYWYDNYKS